MSFVSLTNRVAAAYRRLGAEGAGVLLAVSGGADSLALLLLSVDVAGELGLRVEVASLDHGLRPEAKVEVAGVAALAAGLGVAFHTRRLGLAPGRGLEARARSARYEALEAIRRERGLLFVATGHTANDQAETLLMRLARGAALRGAAGVLPARGTVLRPLLWVTRGEVEEFLVARGLSWVEDPMNRDPAFARVRVRREVLKGLEAAVGPGVERRLARFAAAAAEDDAYLTGLAADAARRLELAPGQLDAVGMRALPPPLQRRVLLLLVERSGLRVDGPAIERAQAAVEVAGACPLSARADLRCEGGMVRVAQRPSAKRDEPALVGSQPVRHGKSGMHFALSDHLPEQGGGWALSLDGAATSLQVRTRQPGDRLKDGRRGRKLQDFLVDAKLPRELRDQIPLIVDSEGDVLGVVGLWPPAVRGPPPAGPFVLAWMPSPEDQAPTGWVRYTLPQQDAWRVARARGQNR